MAVRKVVDPKAFCSFLVQEARRRKIPEFLIKRAYNRCLKEAAGVRIPGLSGGRSRIFLKLREIRRARDQILRNIREHCRQLYKKGTINRETCKIAAAIAAAEIADVFKERFGIRI